MSNWILRATLREVRVEYNGTDRPGSPPPEDAEEWNVLVTALAYPRSGAAVVTCLKELNLPSGEVFDNFGESPTFFDNGLFKEVVQGETALRIHVSDRRPRNTLVRFVRKAFGNGLGALLRGETGRMLGGMVGHLSQSLSDSIADSDQRIRNLTVANTERTHIAIDNDGKISVSNAGTSDSDPIFFENGTLRLTLTATHTFSHTVLDRSHKGRRPRAIEEVLIEAGQPHGHILLDLETRRTSS